MAMLKHLKVLEILYQHKIENFESFKLSDFSLEEIIGKRPTEVAKSITDRDVNEFKPYCDTYNRIEHDNCEHEENIWNEFETREREGWARLYLRICSLFALVAYALLSLPRRWICPSFLHRALPLDIEKGSHVSTSSISSWEEKVYGLRYS
jgi:hypothetical protein